MSMRNKSSFEELCDVLEKNYNFNKNEITYVRNFLLCDLKINEDEDMLLKIKTEAEEYDYNILSTHVISVLAMFFSAFAVFTQLLPEMPDLIDIMIKIVYLLMILIVLIRSLKLYGKGFQSVKKWRRYVLSVLNQISENLVEKEK